MKSKLLFLGLFAIMLFTLTGCCNDCKEKLEKKTAELVEIKKTCPDCRISSIKKPHIPKQTDLDLKIDYRDVSHYQPFIFDILNGFGIVGKLAMNKSEGHLINSVELHLFEVGDCKRYDIKRALYKGKIEGGPHQIVFELNKNNGGEKPLPTFLDMNGKKFKINVGDLIEMEIKSEKLSYLNATIRNGNSGGSFVPLIFPPFICNAKIINGDIK